MNRFNLYKTRFIGAYWQYLGFNVIPTVTWGNANSFTYCLKGIPEESVLGVCGVGKSHCRSANELWNYGIQRVIEEKRPRLLYIYGNPTDSLDITVPYRIIPDFITSRFRKDEKRA